jgi:hypothetical protein
MHHLRWALVLVVIAAACSPSAVPVEAGLWGEPAVVEELRIGVEAGEDEYMFGSIRGVAAAPDGTIYVADRRPVIVRAYDGDGNFLRNVGRQGQGPGEYQYGPLLGVHPNGTVVTRDEARRVSFFTPEGGYLDSFNAAGYAMLVIEHDGDIVVQRGEGDRAVLKRYSVEGEELEEIVAPLRERDGVGFALGGVGLDFLVETISVWSPLGYLVTGRNDRYDIELRDPADTVHLRRNLPRPQVNPEERAEWEAFRELIYQGNLESGREFNVDPVPYEKPYFRGLFAAEDGRIWVRRYVEAEKRDDILPSPDDPDRPVLTWREPVTYDVFEPDSTFLGPVVLSDRFTPMMIRGELLWGVHSDDEGVQRVLRLRVIPEEE